jgi:uncharacterized protein
MKIGIISDTHGLLRPKALGALKGSDLIVHAGDIGDPGVLDTLKTVAKVVAVRGNNDNGPWANDLPSTEVLNVESMWIYVIHDLAQLDLDPVAAGMGIVVSGHSHKPSLETKRGVLYLNPGSAGPRRFNLPVAVAKLSIDGGTVHGELVYLDPKEG